jgi:osmotically inducible protein OsmC
MPTKNASAVWEGTLKGGHGSFTGASGTISGDYTFASRFESAKGTNPEELLAAAEASCFSMALSMGLEQNGTPPTRIETTAACTVAPATGGGFAITTIALTVRVTAPGLDTAALQPIAEATKKNCPVSKALAGNVEITLDAQVA